MQNGPEPQMGETEGQSLNRAMSSPVVDELCHTRGPEFDSLAARMDELHHMGKSFSYFGKAMD